MDAPSSGPESRPVALLLGKLLDYAGPKGFVCQSNQFSPTIDRRAANLPGPGPGGTLYPTLALVTLS